MNIRTAAISPDNVRSLIDMCQLFWNSSPLYTYVQGSRRQIGYELELAGTWGPAQPFFPVPFAQIDNVQRMLKFIAKWLLADVRDCRIEVLPYSNRTYFWTRHRNRPDIVLSVHLLFEDRSDDDGRVHNTLSTLENRLSGIGAPCL